MSDDTSSALRLITPPALEPVTLDQAKAFLRIEDTADDAAITTAIIAARQFAEHYLRAVLLPQTWEYSVANPCFATLGLPVGPAQGITTVTRTDSQGNITALDATHYRLSVDGYAVLFNSIQQTEKLTIRYNASIADTADELPAPIVQGMLHHIAVITENRDGVIALPMQSVTCYQPFRRVVL